MIRSISTICLGILSIKAFLGGIEKEISHKELFTKYYIDRHWGKGPSVSGNASTWKNTEEIRKKIPKMLKKYQCKSMVDVACGDYYWMRQVSLPIDLYIGVDVVEQLVDQNQRKYGSNTHSFAAMDITKEVLPTVDCIFCRDCLVHFSNEDIYKALANFKKSGSKYLLTTSFVNRQENCHMITGEWQPLNLQAEPFNFPPPLEVIKEGCTEGRTTFPDKSLCLWELASIELPD